MPPLSEHGGHCRDFEVYLYLNINPLPQEKENLSSTTLLTNQ
jgi:hypothetical protein